MDEHQNPRIRQTEPIGVNAVKGAISRFQNLPSNREPAALSVEGDSWSGEWDQWYNWDDLGGDDPGWGDIADK